MNSILTHKLTVLPNQPDQSSEVPLPLQAIIPPNPSFIDALYLHIPFCFHKCHYCDFYSIVENPDHDRQQAFTDRLIRELRHRASTLSLKPTTLFVGGGTPTLLRVELWQQLLAALNDLNITDGLEEFTVEANPETVSDELAAVLAQGGVNRVSIGAQSFDPGSLKALERWHEPANVARAAVRFRKAGIHRINLDLIFAIPGQSLAMLKKDIDTALAIEPTHLSTYGLTYEPQTALTQRLHMGQVTPAEESLEKEMYEFLLDYLPTQGFEHYEVSNWARCGETCHHNLAYWEHQNWLGVGPGAGSHVDGWLWKNRPHLGQYLKGEPEPPLVDVEPPDVQRMIGDKLMLGLRLRRGVARQWYETALASDDPRRKTVADMLQIAMMEQTDTHLRLTRKGLLVADHIICRLL